MPRFAFLIGFPITISKPEILNNIYVESLEKIKKNYGLYFRLRYTGKSHEKKCQNYFRVTTNDMMKYRRGQQE